jgi:hypothetical protein
MTTLNVFALADEGAEPFEEAGHRIEFVTCGGLYAAVERIDDRPAVSEAALRTQHDIVAQIARRVDAVLPARFGSMVDTDELTRLVTRRSDAIRQALDLVRGRDQMTVRLFTSAGPVSDLKSRSVRAAAMTGTAYLEERRMAASPVLPPGIAAIAAAVRGLVVAERAEPGQGRVAATVYHLIERAAIDAYKQALEALQVGRESETISVTGPWPPFAFVPDLWL